MRRGAGARAASCLAFKRLGGSLNAGQDMAGVCRATDVRRTARRSSARSSPPRSACSARPDTSRRRWRASPRSAGVTPNTIYWYVQDKDALLVAALDHLLAEALQEFSEQADLPLTDQVLWTLERLQRHRTLINVVHARSERAPVVAAWHDGFHALMDGMVADHLARQGVAEQDRTATARLTTFAVEGLLAHPADPAQTRAVLELVLNRGGRADT